MNLTKEQIEQLAINHSVMCYTPMTPNKESDYIMGVSKNSYAKGFQDCQEMDKWISVEKELPPANTIVLLFCDYQRAFTTGSYYYNLQCFNKHSKDVIGIITHWQPLPTPPKEKGE